MECSLKKCATRKKNWERIFLLLNIPLRVQQKFNSIAKIQQKLPNDTKQQSQKPQYFQGFTPHCKTIKNTPIQTPTL